MFSALMLVVFTASASTAITATTVTRAAPWLDVESGRLVVPAVVHIDDGRIVGPGEGVPADADLIAAGGDPLQGARTLERARFEMKGGEIVVHPSLSTLDRLAASALHDDAIVVDSHVDTTQRFLDPAFDFGREHPDGAVDIPRLRAGGVDAVFFSVWVPGSVTGPEAVAKAQAQIDAIRRTVARHPDALQLASTAADIREARARGRVAALIGIEGGHMIGNDLATLRAFAAAGVRYLTLTHGKNTEWADAVSDVPKHGGLTAFGRQVVDEMNRLGMLIDVSHASDQTFYDALEASRAPIIASHSGCRAVADHPRNLSDAMIRALAARGGVVQINFYMGFLSDAFARKILANEGRLIHEIEAQADDHCGDHLGCWEIEFDRRVRQQVDAGTLPRVEWTAILDHIDHVVRLVGVDHVGLGSDFDGATPAYGLEDASKLPRITAALRERGYSDDDIRKILGGNVLRVMEGADAVATGSGIRSPQSR